MAIFNPQVSPTQDPNYLNYSRVLDAPTPNTSGKIGLETAAIGLDSAVTITDQAIKKGIADNAYEAVDPLRDAMTSGLERVKASLDKGIIPAPVQTVAGASTGKSWLDANAMADPEDNLPVGLADSLGGVQALAAAKAAGSPKLNDTKYAGDVLAEAKRLRNLYGPAYREYVDNKISEASGLPVANSYYNNMLLDINRQMAQMTKVKDDVGAALMKAQDMPGQADLIEKYKADPQKYTSEVLHRINDWENLKVQPMLDKAARETKDANKKDLADKQEGSLSRILNSHVQLNMSALKDASLPGGGTGKDLLQFFDNYSAGRLPNISEKEVNDRRLQMNNFVKNVRVQVEAVANGYVDTIGPEAAKRRVDMAMAPLETQQKFFNNKEDGPGWYMTRMVEHIKKDAASGILLNTDYGKDAAQLMGAREVFGEQYFPTWLGNFAATGVLEKFQGIVGQEAMSAIKPYTDSRGQEIPRYHIDAIKHGKKIGATGDDDYYNEKGVTKVVGMIADKNMPLAAKDKLIDYAFNPKNVGRLEELKMDYRDPVTNKWVDGKYRMFNLLSAPSITQGIKETALVHPENYKQYQKTLEVEFGRLYRSTIQDINKMVSTDKAYLGLHFSFNDKTNQFGLVDKNNRPIEEDPRVANSDRIPAIQNPTGKYISSMQDKLALINGGVANLANVHRNNPAGDTDTPKYLLQALQTAGFRPGSNITGATAGMAAAIIKARNPEMLPQDLDKAILGSQGPAARSNFAPEDDNSLAAFLRSPAGNRRGPPEQMGGRVIKGNLSDEKLLSIQTDEIPAGMDAREFIRQLKAGKKFGGGID